MTVALDKYGNLRDSVSGKVVGMTRNPGESDASYVARGQANLDGIVRDYGNGLSSGTTAYNPERSSQLVDNYATQLTNYQNQLLAAQQQQKQAALQTAYENNSQALNSQKSSVNNAYSSAINSINATKQAQLPQYQEQRNAASADAAQMAQKVRELMAATGRYNSGTNRSQQLAVALDRSRAIQGADAAQNQFSTQIANQLSDVENQKASSLSDVAEKLALLSRQYNQGTLDLNNQIASEKAAAASKAMIDAQTRADQMRQQGIDNSFRNDQFDYNKWLQGQQLDLQNKQYDNGLAIDIAQLMGEYGGSPTLAKQQMDADQAYKSAALAKSYSSGGSGSSSRSVTQSSSEGIQNQRDAEVEVQNQIMQGISPGNIQMSIESQAAELKKAGINIDDLIKYIYQYAGIETTPSEL
jgi:hypothetical protein